MKVAVIGAGFTGLSAAYYLAKSGHDVEVFEHEDRPGGLAIGFKEPHWNWPLEKHYHHLFTSDLHIQNLAAAVSHPINFTRPTTSSFFGPGEIFQLDSPLSLLKFPKLSVFDRLRTGFGLATLRFNPVWQPLEKITAETYTKLVFGPASWSTLWQPLFTGKFGDYSSEIAASWFWARVYKRSPSLGYPEGGFDGLSLSLSKAISSLGVKFHYATDIQSITPSQGYIALATTKNSKPRFDYVICTLPSHLFAKITPGLPASYRQFITQARGIGAVNLVLSLSRQFLTDNTYWLNINAPDFPFLAVVEHTNFISPSHYGGDRLLYIGNYLPATHGYFNKSAVELLSEFTPFLKKINPNFRPNWVKSSWVWKAPFAQPIVSRNYSRQIPSLTTPVPRLYLANIQQVYPWDRGTNYAVELGKKVANELNKSV